MAQLVLTLAGGALGQAVGGGFGQGLGALFGATLGGIIDQQLFGPQTGRQKREEGKVARFPSVGIGLRSGAAECVWPRTYPGEHHLGAWHP
jgi:hypothetical protein